MLYILKNNLSILKSISPGKAIFILTFISISYTAVLGTENPYPLHDQLLSTKSSALAGLHDNDTSIQESVYDSLQVSQQLMQAKIQRQIALNILIFITLLFVSLIALILYWKTQRDKKLNKLLTEQQKEMMKQAEKLYSAYDEISFQSEQLQAAHEEVQAINNVLEKRVKERTTKLLQSRRELDLFLYRSSHDLRRPLTTLMGLVQVGEMDPDITNKAKMVFEHVEHTAIYMDKMLSKLITVSDLNAKVEEKELVNFHSILTDLAQKYKSDLEKRGITFKYQIEGEVQWYERPQRIQAILENLLENAIQFYYPLRDQPQVRIHIKLNHKHASIAVWDNGSGIPEPVRHKVFDMFFRGTQQSQGNGLGLYVVQKAVEGLEGSLHLESEENQFTRFNIDIPLNTRTSQIKKALS